MKWRVDSSSTAILELFASEPISVLEDSISKVGEPLSMVSEDST